MAARYETDEALSIVFVFSDEGTEAWEVVRLFDDVLRDPRVRPGFHFISDQRGCTRRTGAGFVVSAIAIIREAQQRLGASRVAVLMDIQDPAKVDLTYAADGVAQAGITLRVFHNYDAATRWVRNGH